MTDSVRHIEYYYTSIPDQVGEAAKVLNALKAESANLITFNGFETGLGRAQLDFVPSDPKSFISAAEKAGIKLVGPRVAFLVQGEDRLGSVADILNKLDEARINVTAVQAIASGDGRYGAILSVRPHDIDHATQILGAS